MGECSRGGEKRDKEGEWFVRLEQRTRGVEKEKVEKINQFNYTTGGIR